MGVDVCFIVLFTALKKNYSKKNKNPEPTLVDVTRRSSTPYKRCVCTSNLCFVGLSICHFSLVYKLLLYSKLHLNDAVQLIHFERVKLKNEKFSICKVVYFGVMSGLISLQNIWISFTFLFYVCVWLRRFDLQSAFLFFCCCFFPSYATEPFFTVMRDFKLGFQSTTFFVIIYIYMFWFV